jgi:hypothetical protein
MSGIRGAGLKQNRYDKPLALMFSPEQLELTSLRPGITIAATTVKIRVAYRSRGIRHSSLGTITLAQPGVLVYD